MLLPRDARKGAGPVVERLAERDVERDVETARGVVKDGANPVDRGVVATSIRRRAAKGSAVPMTVDQVVAVREAVREGQVAVQVGQVGLANVRRAGQCLLGLVVRAVPASDLEVQVGLGGLGEWACPSIGGGSSRKIPRCTT